NLHLENVGALVKNIKRIPGIVGVAPRLESSVIATHKNTEMGIPVFFINPQDELKVSNFHESMILGEYLSEKDKKVIIIGADLIQAYALEDDTQKRLNVNVGDTVRLSFSNGFADDYKVKGIFKTGSKFSDDKILINYDEYNKIFHTGDVASKILIKLPERGSEDYYKQKIIDLGVSDQINPWQTKMGAVKQFVGSLQITNQITGFIGLLTAFATIYIIIFINVTNKRKQIGILKAVGIKKQIILGSYVLQSLIYGVVGVIIGNLLMQGLLILLTMHPLNMPIGDVIPILTTDRLITTSVTLIFASIIAGFFPSKVAADDNILDAIFGG
ncbi:MAG: ABC transporter permease, partial [Methanosarcinales archaeon]|nr:ABC transporter permease [Methanosarcinales archaeon]